MTFLPRHRGLIPCLLLLPGLLFLGLFFVIPIFTWQGFTLDNWPHARQHPHPVAT
ncbi:MAG TPA: hypothetical protein VK915_08450 [Gaiellaceae bacterium]|nr:hypothetical protein [Gaiellaceae bacterium]